MDSIYINVLRKGIDHGEISVSYIKQNYPIGLLKARKIMDWMQEQGYIEKRGKDSVASKVLLSLDEFEKLYGEN